MTAPPEGRRLTVLIAPDSFKGSLTSVEVAQALADGWKRARPGDEILLAPLADGGEGTLVAVEAAGGWSRQRTPATSPVGVRLEASWLRSDDGRRAYVELAEASGLSRVPEGARAPLSSTTTGTGELLRAVLDAGIRNITLGIGGSATTDGGSGILQALGARFAWPFDDQPDLGPDILLDLAAIDLSGLDPRLAEVDLRVACDVTNPLLGPNGAAATYGPQKGADRDAVAFLDGALQHFADVLEAATGRRERESPGAGAAGGVGFGLLAVQDRFRSFALAPGVDLVMDTTAFDDKLARATLVLTGEGRIDAQTAFGKTALGVARRAHERGLPIVALGGGVTEAGIDALAPLGTVVIPVVERPQSLEEAIAAGTGPLERAAQRVAALIGLTKSDD
jgi:glycerate kinase